MVETTSDFPVSAHGPLEDARARVSDMLADTQWMFDILIDAVREGHLEDLAARLKRRDAAVNLKAKLVRKYVFEHLADSRDTASLASGLILVRMVEDIDQIGDYTLHVGELAPLVEAVVSSKRGQVLKDLVEHTQRAFRLTRRALVTADAEAAREARAAGHEVVTIVDSVLKPLLARSAERHAMRKKHVAVLLLFRYFKRVHDHLMNVCTLMTNPYPQIGCFPNVGDVGGRE